MMDRNGLSLPVRYVRDEASIGVAPTLVVLLFVVALAGRFSLSRVGIDVGVFSDIRLLGCTALVVATLLWRLNPSWHSYSHTWRGSIRLVCLLLGFQIVSALWAPTGVRLGDSLGNVVALVVLVIAAVVITGPDPSRSAQILLLLMYASGVLYAVVGLASVAGVQRRLSAFGGGPNVYVRVVCMGIIAAISLAVIRKHQAWLLPIPLLAVASVLSGSRGGLVAFVGTALVFGLFFFRRAKAKVLISLCGVGLATAIALWSVLGSRIGQEVGQRFSIYALQSDNNFSARPALLSDAWSIWGAHPVVGGGLDSFYAYAGQYVEISYPHNYIAAIAAEGGIVGLLLLALAVAKLWKDARPWATMPAGELGCALAAIYIAIASMFSGDYFDSRFFWILGVVAVNSVGFGARLCKV